MFSLNQLDVYFEQLKTLSKKHPKYLENIISQQIGEENELINKTNSLCPANLTSRNMKAEDIRKALDEGYADGNILKTLMCMNNSDFIFPTESAVGKTYKIRKEITDMNIIGEPSAFGIAATADIEKRNENSAIDNKRLFVVKVPQVIKKQNRIIHEYFVGVFALNNLKSYIPNFAFVLGIFRCSPPYIERKKLSGLGRDKKEKPLSFCQNDVQSKQSVYILYENITNSTTMHNYIKHCTTENFLNILVQITFALSLAYETYDFTHNDLHIDNVLIKELKEEITIPYKRKNGSFIYVKTKIVATIIDLERSHVKVNGKHFGYLLYELDILPNRAYPMYDIFKIVMFSLRIALMGDADYEVKEMKGVIDKQIIEQKVSYNVNIYNDFKDILYYFFTDYTGNNTAQLLESDFFDDTRYALPYMANIYDGNPEKFYDEVLVKLYNKKLSNFVSTTIENQKGSLYGCANTNSCMSIPDALQKYSHSDFDTIENAYDFYEVLTELSSNRNTDITLLQNIIVLGDKNYISYMNFLLTQRKELYDKIMKIAEIPYIMSLAGNNTPDHIKFSNVFLNEYRKYVASVVRTIDLMKTLITLDKIIETLNKYYPSQASIPISNNNFSFLDIEKDNIKNTNIMRKNINQFLRDIIIDLEYVSKLNKKQILKEHPEANWLFTTFETLEYAINILHP